jgi:hypothetical protein
MIIMCRRPYKGKLVEYEENIKSVGESGVGEENRSPPAGRSYRVFQQQNEVEEERKSIQTISRCKSLWHSFGRNRIIESCKS